MTPSLSGSASAAGSQRQEYSQGEDTSEARTRRPRRDPGGGALGAPATA